jgi:tetratricopeptide (TPR) repeat protein
MPHPCRILLTCCLSAALLLAAGCASDQKIAQAVNDYYAANYQQAAAVLQPLAEKTDENFVLNNLRLGSAHLAAYRLDDAQRAFLNAYEVINSLGVNNGGRTLGAVLVSENIKIWKGEPFERAMANFYLGLTFYMQHDYANARGAFENALFKLKDYDANQDQEAGELDNQFALAQLMLAKSWQRLGREDLASHYFDAVAQQHPDLAPLADPQRNASSNVLLVVDFGYGPQKVRQSDGDIVGFGPKPYQAGPIPPPQVLVDGRHQALDGLARPTVDLLALAQQRKWQSIDTIRTIKSALGTGLIAAGAYEGLRRHSDPEASIALLAAGLLLKATSQADIRQWEMLPRTTFLLPLHLPPGTHEITVSFPGAAGVRQTWQNLPVPPEGEVTYYFRMQRWSTGPYLWPPGTPAAGAQVH